MISGIECPPNLNESTVIQSKVMRIVHLKSISDTEDWLHWNGDLDNPIDSEDDCAADIESDKEQDNRIDDVECPEHQDVCAAPNVPGLIRPTWKSKRQAEKVLMTVNSTKTRSNKGVKNK